MGKRGASAIEVGVIEAYSFNENKHDDTIRKCFICHKKLNRYNLNSHCLNKTCSLKHLSMIDKKGE